MLRRNLPGGLTKAAVNQAKPKGKSYKLYDGGGLYLEVTVKGSKYWKYRYRANGQDTCVTLGQHGDKAGCINADLARALAVKARETRNSGGNPLRKFSKNFVPPQSELFSSVSEHWIQKETVNGTWIEDTKIKVEARLANYVYPVLGDIPISALGPQEFRILFTGLIKKDMHSVAHKLYMHCKKIFDHAVMEGLIDSNPLDKLRGYVKEPKSARLNRVSKQDLKNYLISLDHGFGMNSVTQGALKLIHLTFLRSRELRHAKWSDINFDTRIWEVPGLKMKNNEDFIVPLSDQAIEVLKALRDYYPDSELVFPGFSKDKTKPLSGGALLSAIKRMGFDATAHGFRQIASTVLNEVGFNPDAIECQLDHHKESVRMIYNRAQYLDERADMMQWLADSYDDVKRGDLVL